MEKTSKIKIGWLVTAMVVVLLVIDQIIKVYIKTHFCLGESVRVTDWFYIEFVENNGMAWGMSFIGKFWLSLLRLVTICALSIYLHRIIKCGTYRLLYIILVSLVLTGAIGNMIDSVFYGLIFTGASPYTAGRGRHRFRCQRRQHHTFRRSRRRIPPSPVLSIPWNSSSYRNIRR